MNSFKKFVIAVLALALLIGGLESVRSFLIANVIEPIALVFWIAWRIIASVDQNIYWILLIAVCSLLVIRILPNRSDSTVPAAYRYGYRSGNRVNYWKTLITEAIRKVEETENLRESIQKLLISVIRETDGSKQVDLKEAITTRKIPLSLETQRFLFPPRHARRNVSMYAWFNNLLVSRPWLRKMAGNSKDRATRSMHEILKWIETEMEINDEK